MARAGRKRKQGAKRRISPSKRPPDLGTPELQRKRRESVPQGADPNLASYAIDQLHAGNRITQAEKSAGWSYAVLFWAEYGRPFVTSHGSFDESGGEAPNMEAAIAMAGRLKDADSALRDSGMTAFNAVREICVYGRTIWNDDAKRGFTALTKHFGYS